MTDDTYANDAEAWEDDLIDPDDPLRDPNDPDDIPEVEQPVEPFEDDEVALESPQDLDDLATDADIAPDESEMDHNLPANTGMPE